jgi:hypothetical protein
MSGSLPVYNPPQQQNPLVTLGQMAGGVTQLRDFQAKQAAADAYQASIDPNTGAFDQGKFNALIGSTPQGAWNAGPTMQQSGAAQAAQGVGTQQQVAAARAQLSGISAFVQPLFQKTLDHEPVTGQQVLDTLNQVPAGLATPEMRANIQKQVASLGGPNADATSLVRGIQFGTMTGQEQLQTLYPPMQPVNLGNTVQPFQPSPLAQGGAGFTGGGVGAATTLTPAQAVTPIDIRMSDNSIVQKLPAEVPAFLNQNPGASVIGPSSTAGVAPQPGAAPPGARTTAPAAAPAPAARPQAAALPPLTVGPPPQPIAGRSAPMGSETAAAATAAQSTALGSAAGGVPQRLAILSDMQSALNGPHPLNTGPYADWAANWSALVNRLPDGLASLIPGMTKEQVAGQEGFVKMAEQLRQLQGQQISGALTNDKFASALASSPHLALSRLGNLGMVSILEGNEDAIAAKNSAWQDAQSQGWQPKDFQTWQTQFNKTPAADPRIYWLERMSQGDRLKFVAGMDPAQKTRLRVNYELAHQ